MPATPHKTWPGPKPRAVTAEGWEAITEAQFAAEQVRDHKDQAARFAAQRARAVLRANRCGVSYRQIAEALGVSLGMSQQWMRAALRLEEQES